MIIEIQKEVVIIKTIQDVRYEFNLTARSLRYYEEIGILEPTRSETNQRLYSKKELTKLKLIERGKNFGFSLDQIKEMILLFDRDRTGEKQLKRTIAYGDEKINEINVKISELQTIKQEVKALQTEFIKKLDKFEGE